MFVDEESQTVFIGDQHGGITLLKLEGGSFSTVSTLEGHECESVPMTISPCLMPCAATVHCLYWDHKRGMLFSGAFVSSKVLFLTLELTSEQQRWVRVCLGHCWTKGSVLRARRTQVSADICSRDSENDPLLGEESKVSTTFPTPKRSFQWRTTETSSCGTWECPASRFALNILIPLTQVHVIS